MFLHQVEYNHLVAINGTAIPMFFYPWKVTATEITLESLKKSAYGCFMLESDVVTWLNYTIPTQSML